LHATGAILVFAPVMHQYQSAYKEVRPWKH